MQDGVCINAVHTVQIVLNIMIHIPWNEFPCIELSILSRNFCNVLKYFDFMTLVQPEFT